MTVKLVLLLSLYINNTHNLSLSLSLSLKQVWSLIFLSYAGKSLYSCFEFNVCCVFSFFFGLDHMYLLVFDLCFGVFISFSLLLLLLFALETELNLKILKLQCEKFLFFGNILYAYVQCEIEYDVVANLEFCFQNLFFWMKYRVFNNLCIWVLLLIDSQIMGCCIGICVG